MPRILIVEDEPDIARVLRDDLALEGYDAVVVGDGEAAHAATTSSPFDLVLLDVMLPGRDGFDVCRDLRRAGLTMPIIMLTAKTQESDKVMGLEIGADDYVTKPFSPRELRARVKAALRRAAADAPEVYRFGQIEVDFGRRELRAGGAPVDVTAIEFKLLAAFIRHRGRVLSREQLLDEAWGRDVYVTDRAVDTHIVNVRRKIEPDPAVPRYLVSVRGAGYRFEG
ncbi:MAG: DNA-binding response regulator [Acidobacteria bacterium RIFCSPLOWO2_02_FULL_67_36]|nr:MAG: DNA-binding response regulator [Acidobacteria bacterium RIFCSPLOWO2_02_FULL_67_36]OFW21099.1 MAG: DNA-binding response regulator [Acidobacteria bacterium RIFCSPLOWO2_12_FULL_66_21]